MRAGLQDQFELMEAQVLAMYCSEGSLTCPLELPWRLCDNLSLKCTSGLSGMIGNQLQTDRLSVVIRFPINGVLRVM